MTKVGRTKRSLEEAYRAADALAKGRRPAWAQERAASDEERRRIAGGAFWNVQILSIGAIAAVISLVVLWPRPSGPTPAITVAVAAGLPAVLLLPAWAFARHRGRKTLGDDDEVRLQPVAIGSTVVGVGKNRRLVLVVLPVDGSDPVAMGVVSATGLGWQELTAWAWAAGLVRHRGHIALVFRDGAVVVGSRPRRIVGHPASGG
jgi:hypothetical protein